jgi:hypothetical protein
MPFTIDDDRPEMFEVEPLSLEELAKEEAKTTKKSDSLERLKDLISRGQITIDDIIAVSRNDTED